MKVIGRNVSYNRACMILEANCYNVAETKTNIKYGITVFIDRTGRKIARYTEKYGRLEVLCCC
jgi:hypothetical protein